MSQICGVSKTIGEWYQKTNKIEDTNKLTLSTFKIIAILHKTLLATFIKLLETVSIGLFRNRSLNQPLSHVLGLPLHGITCSSSGGAPQAPPGKLGACYVSCLHKDWSAQDSNPDAQNM
jgi:hypothetical protein